MIQHHGGIAVEFTELLAVHQPVGQSFKFFIRILLGNPVSCFTGKAETVYRQVGDVSKSGVGGCKPVGMKLIDPQPLGSAHPGIGKVVGRSGNGESPVTIGWQQTDKSFSSRRKCKRDPLCLRVPDQHGSAFETIGAVADPASHEEVRRHVVAIRPDTEFGIIGHF